MRVTLAECPRPLHEWRVWPRGTSLDDVLCAHAAATTPVVTPASTTRPRQAWCTCGSPNPPRVRGAALGDHDSGGRGRGRRHSDHTAGGDDRDAPRCFRRWRNDGDPRDGDRRERRPGAVGRVQAAHFPTGEILGSGHGDDRGEVVVPLARATNAVGATGRSGPRAPDHWRPAHRSAAADRSARAGRRRARGTCPKRSSPCRPLHRVRRCTGGTSPPPT